MTVAQEARLPLSLCFTAIGFGVRLPPEISLDQLERGCPATVIRVDEHAPGDVIAERLRHIGFVPGERVLLQTFGPIGREPLLIQVGTTRFALRRTEASRVLVEPEAAA